ncbi:MAG: iron-containing alcohol dehydrogenase [Promethearchaeota archaeon]
MSSIDPRFILIEKGALQRLDEIMGEYRQVICVTDELIYSGYRDVLEGETSGTVQWLMVSECEKDISSVSLKGDIIIGFGGGRSLDMAKRLAKKSNLEWISVPTAASHDGIASDVASVSHNGYRYSERCKSPIAVVADLSIIAKAPAKLRLAGLGDIICKASSLGEWKLAHNAKGEAFDHDVYSMVNSALDSVFTDESLESLVNAQIVAGKAMKMFGSSRPCSGTEHSISHAMDRDLGELHGLQVAFATPICLFFLEKTGYAQYSSAEMHQFLADREIPNKLDDFDISEKQFLKYIGHGLDIMRDRDRYSVLDYLQVRNQDILDAMRQVGY